MRPAPSSGAGRNGSGIANWSSVPMASEARYTIGGRSSPSSQRLSEEGTVGVQRATARPVVDQTNELESTRLHFGRHGIRRHAELAAAEEERRREIDDGEHATRAQRTQQASVDAGRVAQIDRKSTRLNS